jgi:IS4 transposase
MVYDVWDRRPLPEGGKILADEEIVTGDGLRARRIVALLQIEGQERPMRFLTNNSRWSAQTVADLYRCRWEIEVFSKQIKQLRPLWDASEFGSRQC